MTTDETNIHWENRKWFEENLPVPPIKLFITKTNDIPGEIIYEDMYQIAVKNSKHSGEGYITSEYDN